MADVIFKDERRVMLRLRLEREVFDALVIAYGSQGRALRALREDLPHELMWLVRRALVDADGAEPARRPAASRAARQSSAPTC